MRSVLEETRARRWAGYAGLAAAVLYIGATLSGSFLDPSYSQIRQHVSDLTASGAPTRIQLAPVYILYNFFVIAFAVALYLASNRRLPFKIGTGLLVINAIAGILMVTWFAEDPGGAPITSAGKGHVAFAGVSSLAILIGSFVYVFAFRTAPGWRPLSALSFAAGIGFALLGPLAAVATAVNSYLAGLAERGPIGVFILWVLAVSCRALVQSSRDRQTSRVSSPITTQAVE